MQLGTYPAILRSEPLRRLGQGVLRPSPASRLHNGRRGRKRYRVSVLEVVNTDINIEQVEEAWKRKLLTGGFGLNDPRPDTPLPDGLGGSAHLQSSIVEPQP